MIRIPVLSPEGIFLHDSRIVVVRAEVEDQFLRAAYLKINLADGCFLLKIKRFVGPSFRLQGIEELDFTIGLYTFNGKNPITVIGFFILDLLEIFLVKVDDTTRTVDGTRF